MEEFFEGSTLIRDWNQPISDKCIKIDMLWAPEGNFFNFVQRFQKASLDVVQIESIDNGDFDNLFKILKACEGKDLTGLWVDLPRDTELRLSDVEKHKIRESIFSNRNLKYLFFQCVGQHVSLATDIISSRIEHIHLSYFYFNNLGHDLQNLLRCNRLKSLELPNCRLSDSQFIILLKKLPFFDDRGVTVALKDVTGRFHLVVASGVLENRNQLKLRGFTHESREIHCFTRMSTSFKQNYVLLSAGRDKLVRKTLFTELERSPKLMNLERIQVTLKGDQETADEMKDFLTHCLNDAYQVSVYPSKF